MTFSFGTLCSGIDAAAQAFQPLGADLCYVSEIEPFPSAVLNVRHGASRPKHWPTVAKGCSPKELTAFHAYTRALKTVGRSPWLEPKGLVNYGDFTQIEASELPAVDLLVAGTPCQGFSLAGLRGSLDDGRGQLTLKFVKLVHELVDANKVKAVLWENVYGVLHTPDNAFGCFLGGLVQAGEPLAYPGGRWPDAGMVRGPGGRVAWRVLDAQHFGLPQRRRRVFVVADFAGWIDPAAVLFERLGQASNPVEGAQGREDHQRDAPDSPGGAGTLGSAGQVAETPSRGSTGFPDGLAFAMRGRAGGAMPEVHGDGSTIGTLRASSGGSSRDYLVTWEDGSDPVVRRMTCIEAERSMGFEDDFTKIPYLGRPAEKCPEGPRFKAIGNSKSIPVVRWLGERIILSAAMTS